MDVHASPAELPELHEFLRAFQVRFRRPEGRAALERYTTAWKPIVNLVEGNLQVFLVRAGHVKRVPGRKTDKREV